MRKIDEEYKKQLTQLVERAKLADPNAKGLNLGERFFVELLSKSIDDYRTRRCTQEQLSQRKKELEQLLIDYWDQAQTFREDVRIRNTMSHILTQAEKSGCPTCGRLVRIFDGRERA